MGKLSLKCKVQTVCPEQLDAVFFHPQFFHMEVESLSGLTVCSGFTLANTNQK